MNAFVQPLRPFAVGDDGGQPTGCRAHQLPGDAPAHVPPHDRVDGSDALIVAAVALVVAGMGILLLRTRFAALGVPRRRARPVVGLLVASPGSWGLPGGGCPPSGATSFRSSRWRWWCSRRAGPSARGPIAARPQAVHAARPHRRRRGRGRARAPAGRAGGWDRQPRRLRGGQPVRVLDGADGGRVHDARPSPGAPGPGSLGHGLRGRGGGHDRRRRSAPCGIPTGPRRGPRRRTTVGGDRPARPRCGWTRAPRTGSVSCRPPSVTASRRLP